MKLPDAVLIGAQKAGTSSLFDWVSQHPEIEAPDSTKDLHFFSDETLYRNGKTFLQGFFSEQERSKVTLMGGVNHLYFHSLSAHRIRDCNPHTKLIAILRDPTERAYSAYRYFHKLQQEPCETFEEALALEKGRLSCGDHTDQGRFSYVRHGLYAQQLEGFLEMFPRDQILIVFFEDLREDPHHLMREVFEFLDVDSGFAPRFATRNQTGAVRLKSINRLLFTRSRFMTVARRQEWLRRLIRPQYRMLVQNTIRDWNTKESEAAPLRDETRKHLMHLFSEDVGRIEQLTGRDLSRWTTIPGGVDPMSGSGRR